MIPLGGFSYPAPREDPEAASESDSLKSAWKCSQSFGRKSFQAKRAAGTPTSWQAASLAHGELRKSSVTSTSSKSNSPQPSPGHSLRSSTSSCPSIATTSKPKYIPIVIPEYDYSAFRDDASQFREYSSPVKATARLKQPFTQTPYIPPAVLSGESSPVDAGSRKDSVDPTCPRLRHVEIAIPEFARFLFDRSDHLCTGSPLEQERKYTGPLPPARDINAGVDEMSGRARSSSRANTLDSTTSAPSPSQLGLRNGNLMQSHLNSASSTSLHRLQTPDNVDRDVSNLAMRTPGSAIPPTNGTPANPQTAGLGTPTAASTAGLSGLVCNVHRTTGREPHPLVGATTTVLGDKLYVFGGRRLSRTKPQLTADLYELDLVRRHWTKLEVKGDIPPPRYFHSVCALGDTKLVCYGGMSPARPISGGEPQPAGQDGQPEVVVMSDIHIYDVPTQTWMHVQAQDAPQGRYAHCAAILPSSAIFSSSNGPMSAVQHNPASTNPNQGSIGISLDGQGGAEMVVVGGQDSANHYIEQVSVFNLRSLRWMATNSLGRSCGAYRSVVAPLTTMESSAIGTRPPKDSDAPAEDRTPRRNPDGSSCMLIYSNYNFLDVKLELQVRLADGTLSEKPMHGSYSPPGLRFPNGGVINNHFVVSGTFLTSSKQEYALWALDLRSLTWSRIDAGGSHFSQGSWNRGVLWSRRNTFVILGNRKRSLVEDYNHRRINFTNICMVELEAFGLYDNPRKVTPMAKYVSVSSPPELSVLDHNTGGRQLLPAAEELGQLALGLRELCDMDFLCISGERVPVNSRIIARRWGPYFNTILREGVTEPEETNDTATLRPSGNSMHPSRNSSITITPSVKTAYSNATTLTNNTADTSSAPPGANPWEALGPQTGPAPTTRPRTLYLPHTQLTVQALIHYLYTSSLPPLTSPLCTPQILCSLLQIARPYQIDGLLEAIIERQHAVLDGRNTAAIFNAAAMAAGGGSSVASSNGLATGTRGVLSASSLREVNQRNMETQLAEELNRTAAAAAAGSGSGGTGGAGAAAIAGTTPTAGGSGSLANLRINTETGTGLRAGDVSDDELSSASTSTSTSELSARLLAGLEREVWAGELSAVVGLQKRGLRGLMEGRRMREMRGGSGSGPGGQGGGVERLGSDGGVGLGIA